MLQVKSVYNTPIKGCWSWLQKTIGHGFAKIVQSGLVDGIYNPNEELHVYVCSYTFYLPLFILLEIYSIGYGLIFYSANLMILWSTGITIGFDLSQRNWMSQAPLLVMHLLSQSIMVDRM